MASVVFLRAVNVGLHQRFSPSALAKDLSDFGVVNIGAAGTLVATKNVSEGKLKAEILHRLKFKPELMICSAADVLAIADGKAFGKIPAGKELKPFITIIQKPLSSPPKLPIDFPPGGKWEVRIVAVIGQFVLTLRRPGDLYSNAVVEKLFGVPATTRGWNTIESVVKALRE
jgi:uncharacterized protein (DUF1697 family)